jgi:hypothetical protein
MLLRQVRSLLFRQRLLDAGARARREHSTWLTQALCTRVGVRAPRIPTRKVDDGGFDRLMSDPRGQRVARQWWTSAFEDGDEAR